MPSRTVLVPPGCTVNTACGSSTKATRFDSGPACKVAGAPRFCGCCTCTVLTPARRPSTGRSGPAGDGAGRDKAKTRVSLSASVTVSPTPMPLTNTRTFGAFNCAPSRRRRLLISTGVPMPATASTRSMRGVRRGCATKVRCVTGKAARVLRVASISTTLTV